MTDSIGTLAHAQARWVQMFGGQAILLEGTDHHVMVLHTARSPSPDEAGRFMDHCLPAGIILKSMGAADTLRNLRLTEAALHRQRLLTKVAVWAGVLGFMGQLVLTYLRWME